MVVLELAVLASACAASSLGRDDPRLADGAASTSEVSTLTAPERFCRSRAQDDEVLGPEPDDATLTVAAVEAGLRVESRGARAGRLIVALGEAAGQAVLVRGRGAGVRIYAHVAGRPFDEVLSDVAGAAGMVVERRDAIVEVSDPDLWVRNERSRRAAQIALMPLETRVVGVESPQDAARVVAEILLSCRGRVTAAPERGVIVVTDIPPTLDRIEELLRVLEQPAAVVQTPPDPRRVEGTDDRRGTYGVPDHWLPSCTFVPRAAASMLRDGQLLAEGQASGDLLLALAAREGQAVVVGCGGDLPAYVRPAEGAPLGDVAALLDLWPMSRNAYTSQEISLAFASQATRESGGDESREVLVFEVPLPEALAQLAPSVVGEDVAVAAYPPTSAIVIGGRARDLAMAERLVEVWRDGGRTR
jgi:hypothetical protein